MKYIADLHLHSKYSMATSKHADLEGYWQWAQIKGIQVLATGDFTHPVWSRELAQKLEPAENGFFRLKHPPGLPEEFGMKEAPVWFCLGTEISSIYKKKGRTRKIHSLVFLPDFASLDKFNTRLGKVGNLKADGRPILGLDAKDLLAMALEASGEAVIIPAHIWTPWFSLFGSKSGFDDIEECYEDLSRHVFALETGLSSDPAMNRRLAALDRFSLVSNSDAHSPGKLGREATRFDAPLSYRGMFDALRSGQGLTGTIEFFPQEGKYHMDGHRKCGVCVDPSESGGRNGKCPVCGKEFTLGVMHRVNDLADRSGPESPAGEAETQHLIPLPEVLSEIMACGPGSKKVQAAYAQAIAKMGPEFQLLLESSLDQIRSAFGEMFAEAVRRMREGEIRPQSGYDGIFGIIRVFSEEELRKVRV